jgi:hypothetical protein
MRLWADVAGYVSGGRFAEPGRADVRPLRQRGTQESAPINDRMNDGLL